jgi:hypothetical protein
MVLDGIICPHPGYKPEEAKLIKVLNHSRGQDVKSPLIDREPADSFLQ